MMAESILVIDNVSKSFARADTDTITHALNNINLTVRQGEFVSVVGPSGCGKSTLLRLIAGLIFPTTGEIKLDKERVEGANPDRGMVFQKPTLFPWLTVRGNVAYSLKVQNKYMDEKEEVDRLIAKVGLDEFKDSYPHQLSGGMAQRVSLIRTLINKPRVCLLDEPLGALDAFTRMSMQDELLDMWRENKQITVMVTHDVDEAIYMSNRVVVMAPRPGRIRKCIDINLEYPRNRLDDDFVSYRKEILEMLDFGKRED